jgi:hypothetical protein
MLLMFFLVLWGWGKPRAQFRDAGENASKRKRHGRSHAFESFLTPYINYEDFREKPGQLISSSMFLDSRQLT